MRQFRKFGRPLDSRHGRDWAAGEKEAARLRGEISDPAADSAAREAAKRKLAGLGARRRAEHGMAGPGAMAAFLLAVVALMAISLMG